MGPWQLQRAFRAARSAVEGLPEGFRFHDLRHYYASLLISSGLDVKVVQTRLRHATASTTLDTYGHLWPDSDEHDQNRGCCGHFAAISDCDRATLLVRSGSNPLERVSQQQEHPAQHAGAVIAHRIIKAQVRQRVRNPPILMPRPA